MPNQFTPAEENALRQIIQNFEKTVTDAINRAPGAIMAGIPTVEASIDSGGEVAYYRQGFITLVRLDTYAFQQTTEFTNIYEANGRGLPGDIVIISPLTGGRVPVAVPSNDLDIKSECRITSDVSLILMQSPITGAFKESSRTSVDGSIVAGSFTFDTDAVQTIEDVGGIRTISGSAPIIPVRSEQVGEVDATCDIQCTAGGTNSSIEVFIDIGSGPFSASGLVTFAGAPTVLQVAQDVEAAINAMTSIHGFSAADDGVDTVTITAPAGYGATGNTFIQSTVVTGGLTVVEPLIFSGGVDGSDQDDTLENIEGIQGLIVLQNSMSANTITLDSTGGFFDFKETIPAGASVVLIRTGTSISKFGLNAKTTIGEGLPDDAVGMNGDYYIETLKNALYTKSSGSYVLTSILHSWEREIMATSAGISGRSSAGATSVTPTFVIDSQGVWSHFQTASGSGNAGGVFMARWARVSHIPESMVVFKFPESTTSERVFVGLNSNAAGWTNSDTPAGEYLGMRYSTVAGDTKFIFIMKGVAAEVSTTSGITPTISTGYILWMKYDPSTDIGYLKLFDLSGTLLASASLTGSALSDGSELLTHVVVWSQAAGAGGQRIIGLHKIGGRVWT